MIAYDGTSLYTNTEFSELIKAVDDALPQEVSCPRLEKIILKTYIDQILEILLANNYTTTFTTKLSEPPGARFHPPNSCPKIHHTRTKSKFMPVSEMKGT